MGYDWIEITMFAIVAIIVVGLVLIVADWFGSTPLFYEAKVVQLSYSPSKLSVGTGYGVTSNGQTGVVMTTTTESEKWNVIVTIEEKYTVAAQTNGNKWGNLKPGDIVKVRQQVGWIFHGSWGFYID